MTKLSEKSSGAPGVSLSLDPLASLQLAHKAIGDRRVSPGVRRNEVHKGER